MQRYAHKRFRQPDTRVILALLLRPESLQVTVSFMLGSFKHKSLERFFVKGLASEIQSMHRKRLRLILGRWHAATTPRDMNLSVLFFHQLSGNWRVTFTFDGPEAIDVDFEDYR